MLNIKTAKNETDGFSFLVLLYFTTLHADQLHFVVGGFTIRVNNLLAFLLIVLVVMRFRMELFTLHKNLAYPLIGVTLSICVSWMFSPYKHRCTIFLGWWGLTLLCYVLLPYFLVKLWSLERVFKLYCLSFLLVGAYATTQLILSFFQLHDPFTTQYITSFIVRPNAFCFEPSFYALYMTPFIFMYNYHYLVERERPFFIFTKRGFRQSLLVNLLYVVSTSTAVLFAYMIFVPLVFILKIDRKRLIHFVFSICACCSVIALIFPFMLRQFFMKFFFTGFMAHHSFFERFIGLVNGWKIFLCHPLVGVGLGGYPCCLMEAYLQESGPFTFLPMHALIIDRTHPIKLFEAMSVSTELLASLGVVGLCAFIYLFMTCVRMARSHQNRNGHTLMMALLVSLILTLCIWQFNQGLLRTYIWVHFALTFAFIEKQGNYSRFSPKFYILTASKLPGLADHK